MLFAQKHEFRSKTPGDRALQVVVNSCSPSCSARLAKRRRLSFESRTPRARAKLPADLSCSISTHCSRMLATPRAAQVECNGRIISLFPLVVMASLGGIAGTGRRATATTSWESPLLVLPKVVAQIPRESRRCVTIAWPMWPGSPASLIAATAVAKRQRHDGSLGSRCASAFTSGADLEDDLSQ